MPGSRAITPSGRIKPSGWRLPPAGSSPPAADRQADTSAIGAERSGDEWISRKITTNGVISVAWQEISCGKHRAGRRVDIHLQGPVMQIFDGEELIKTVLRTERQGGEEEARREGELDRATMTDEV